MSPPTIKEITEAEAEAKQCIEWLYAKYPDIPRTAFHTNLRLRMGLNGVLNAGHFFISANKGVINFNDPCPLCDRPYPHIEVSLEKSPPYGTSGKFERETVKERVLEEFHHHRNSVLRARSFKDKDEEGESFIDTANQSLAEHDAEEEEIRTDVLVKQDLAEYEAYLKKPKE